MKERPVLFRDELVRQILASRKDVTRRLGVTWARVKPGDRLWVREAHCSMDMGPLRRGGPVAYRADYPHDDEVPRGPWRPSIHMPRWASRIDLEVVSLTEQREVGSGWPGGPPVLLPDVHGDEARREGFADRASFLAAWQAINPHDLFDQHRVVYRVEFRCLPTSSPWGAS